MPAMRTCALRSTRSVRTRSTEQPGMLPLPRPIAPRRRGSATRTSMRRRLATPRRRAAAPELVVSRSGLRPMGGGRSGSVRVRGRGLPADAGPARPLRGAGERPFEVVLENGQAVEAGDLGDGAVDLADLLPAL